MIPKILALKYILTYFDGKPHAKEEYKSVYSVFCAAVLFTVFANKKESDTFYNFVRLEEWKSKINKWLYDYISSHALTRGKVLAAYKYSESDDDPIQQIRCKSLAAISNFFKVTKNGDNYNMGISNAAELCKFFGDKTVYSLEHFIVGECGTLHVKTAKYDFPYKYPPTIQKYRNSLFNFIFIPQPLNSSLSNEGLFIKVAEIHTHENEIKCSYSKGYYHRSTRANTPANVSFRCFLPFSPWRASARLRLKSQKTFENTSPAGAEQFCRSRNGSRQEKTRREYLPYCQGA